MSPDEALTAIIAGTADFHRAPDTYYRSAGSRPPVFRTAEGGPWMCASRAAATEVLGDPEAFRMRAGELAGGTGDATALLAEHWLELSEGEPHRAARRLLGGVLAATDPTAAVEAALAGLRLPAADRRADLIADLVTPFWQRFLPRWLGLDADRLADLDADIPAVMAAVMGTGTPDRDRVAAAVDILVAAVEDAGGGIAGGLRARCLSPRLVAAYLVNLVVDVSVVPIGLAVSVARLLGDPLARAAMAAGGDRRRTALAECVRLDPPQTMLIRRAVRDRHVAGVRVRADDVVVILVGLANRDAAAFAAPAKFRPGRAQAALTFGLGPHACLGRRLFLQLADAVVAAALDQMPDLVPAGPSTHRDQVGLRSIESLPAGAA